jgi:hypothetical protein
VERFLGKKGQKRTMINSSIPLQFSHLGIAYAGWAEPSKERHEDGLPKSYAVVLNGTFFGNFFCDRGKWVIDQKRPYDLVVAAGERLSEWLITALRAFA